jgi:EpsI family protein
MQRRCLAQLRKVYRVRAEGASLRTPRASPPANHFQREFMKIRLALLCLVLISASAFIARASRPEIVPIRAPLSELPMQIGDWKGQASPEMDPRVRAVLGVDDYINRVYYGPELYPAGLYIGYYQSQREGDTMHSPLNCLPGAGWNPMEKGHILIPIDESVPIEINRILIMKGTDRQLVLYWYQSHGRVIASEYWGKIYTVLDALRMNRTDAALVRVVCPLTGLDAKTEIAVELRAVEFVKTLFPVLERFLPA